MTAVALLIGNFCRAEDAPPKAEKRMENRFLFVVNTSSAMKSRTNGTDRAVLDLLDSDMHGEFRKGDTIGFWTYDETIHSDLPMLVWSKNNKETIEGDVMRFLRHQKYDGHAHLDKVLTTISHVLQQSERLTIILIHDGSDPIHGTEFDVDINELQKKYARQFRAAHLPIVTVFAARGSIVYDYTINYPNAVSVPHTAFPEPPPETNKPPVQAIVAAPVSTNAAPVVLAPPRHIEIVMAGTNHFAHEMTQAELAAITSPSAPSNTVASALQQSQPPPTGPTSASTPTPAGGASDSQPVSVTAETAASKLVSVASTSIPVTSTAPAPVSQPKPVEPIAHATVPVPIPPSAIPSAAEARPVTAPTLDTTSITIAPAGQQAALFIIAISLLTIAFVLVVFLVKRLRSDASPSLISQSMDRSR